MAGVVESLLTALSTCFAIIFLGYVLGRTDVIPVSLGAGINKFIGMISLPALLFRAMATLDFSSVSWSFVLGVGLAKVLVFIFVLLATVLFDKQSVGQISTGALRGIFCTQSNDFALALPIAIAMYDESNAAWPSFIYLLAPISLVLINPIGMVIMEYGNVKKAKAKAKECTIDYFDESGVNTDVSVDYYGIFRRVVTNPIVFMTFIGLIANFILSGTLPLAIDNLLATLGQAFSPCSLFLLGHSMVGKLTTLSGPSLLVPVTLSLVKVLVLGIICYMLVSALGGDADLKMYAFIVGATPTAPSLQYLASLYNLSPDKISMALVVCTIIGAPVMLIGAQLQLLDKDEDTKGVGKELIILNSLSLIGCIWVILSFSVEGYYKRISKYRHIFFMTLSQALLSASTLVCTVNMTHLVDQHVMLIPVDFFRFSSMMWGAFIAILFPAKSLGIIGDISDEALDRRAHGCIWGTSIVLSVVIFINSAQHGTHHSDDNCIFSDGIPHLALTILLMLTCLSLQIWSIFGLRQALPKQSDVCSDDNAAFEPLLNQPFSNGNTTTNVNFSAANDAKIEHSLITNDSESHGDNSDDHMQRLSALENLWLHYMDEQKLIGAEPKNKQRIFSKVSLGFFLISLYQIAFLTVDAALFVWILASDTDIAVLSFLAIALLSSQGLITFFVFGFRSDQTVLNKMRVAFGKCQAGFSTKREIAKRTQSSFVDLTS